MISTGSMFKRGKMMLWLLKARKMRLILVVPALLASCSREPEWSVVLLVPERAAIASDPEPAYQLRHVGVDYPTRKACVAVWGDRCAEKGR